MKKAVKQQHNKSATRTDQPFRLNLHIGAGKTGTSSIQETLRTQQDKLKKQGNWYLGLMLEHAPAKRFTWQKANGIHEFLTIDSKAATEQVLAVLRAAIPAIQESGARQAVWSNEWFYRHGTQAVFDAMCQLAADGVDVRVIAYVRRHDAWARSAYVQWGLKQKTYDGPILPFRRWIKQRPPGFFHERLEQWVDAFDKKVIVRNLDAVGDAVTDFLGVIDIAPGSLDKMCTNETPSGEELVLRTLFNEQFKGHVPAGRFDRVLGRNGLSFDRPIDGWLSQMMPDEEALGAVAADCMKDRNGLDELLAERGEPRIETSPLALKPITVDPNKVITTVCQLVINQALKIEQLERKMEEITNQNVGQLAAKPGSDSAKREAQQAGAPVFLISTGRSGSTLVQRVLNCHRELVVWGEHFGFLNGLANSYVQMANPEQPQYPKKPGNNKGPSQLLPTLADPAAPLEWANPWSLQEFRGQLKQFIEDYFAGRLEPGTRWGFKEILYNRMPTLRMLCELFPNGRFVFIKRDALEVTRSKVFAFIKESKWTDFSDAQKRRQIENMLNEVYEHYRVYDTFMDRYPGRGLIVNYEDLVANPREVTAGMLSHLALAPERFDWTLGDQVMGTIITTTKRDDAVIELIRDVAG